MKSGFVTVRSTLADPEPPQPIPFPVRIVRDPRPPKSIDHFDLPAPREMSPKTDSFYQSWDRFLAVQPKRARKVSRAARKVAEVRAEVAASPKGEGLKVEENAATSWEQATAECRAKVAAIVEECNRLNQKYRDAIFNPESNPYCLQSLSGSFPGAVENVDAPPWIKRVEDIFDKPQFFIDGATASDVHQGNGGDCWFLAALMAISAKKELIEDVCVARDEEIGVYGFVFYRDGEWIYEVIDDKLYMRVGDDDELWVVRDWDREKKEGTGLAHDEDKLKDTLQRSGEALYFSHCKSDETWLPLIEKAYAKAHGDYCAIEGGSASEGIEDLTGGVAVVINPEDIMDKDRFWREQLSQVNEKYLFGGGTKSTPSRGFVGGHAYTVLRTYEEGDLKLLKLRNPWGEAEWEGDWSDGSKMWTPQLMTKLDHTFGNDGIFWISYKDFLKQFPHINRVRLFNKEWKVAQQWTCVDVPWTVDYLDTKFEITVSERGPLVIVLSQPDPRYFYGLSGRYMYSLHFRVYKQGSSSYLFRSMHNSGNGDISTRSVSAELDDVEPGKYSVIFKVTAIRVVASTPAEVIEKYAADRKEKLLDVGLKFDYAQTKGKLREFEKEHQRRKRAQEREEFERDSRRSREVKMKDRVREKLRKKRIADAMHEKRKLAEEKEREKRKRQRARVAERRERERELALSTAGESQVTSGATEGEASSEKCDITTPLSETGTLGIDGAPKPAEHTVKQQPAQLGDQHKDPVDTSQPTDQATKLEGITSSIVQPTVKHDARRTSTEALTSSLASITLDKQRDPTHHIRPRLSGFAPTTTTFDSDSSESDSPASPVCSLHDEDFPWDSEIDGDAYLSTSTSTSSIASSSSSSSSNSSTLSSPSTTTSSRRPSQTIPIPSPPENDNKTRHEGQRRPSSSRLTSTNTTKNENEKRKKSPRPPKSDSKAKAKGKSSARVSQLEFFADDPWNAMLVLGLRVYSKGDVRVGVGVRK